MAGIVIIVDSDKDYGTFELALLYGTAAAAIVATILILAYLIVGLRKINKS